MVVIAARNSATVSEAPLESDIVIVPRSAKMARLSPLACEEIDPHESSVVVKVVMKQDQSD